MLSAYEYLRHHARVAVACLEAGEPDAAEASFVEALFSFEHPTESLSGYDTMSVASAIRYGVDAFNEALCEAGLCLHASGFVVVDAAGELEQVDSDPTPGQLARVLAGEPLGVLCRVNSVLGLVNAAAHTGGARAERNPVGAVLLAAMGARHAPYSGAVVVTGWHEGSGQLRPLSPEARMTVTNLHATISAVLAGQNAAHWPEPLLAEIRALAERVRTAPMPPVRTVRRDDVV